MEYSGRRSRLEMMMDMMQNILTNPNTSKTQIFSISGIKYQTAQEILSYILKKGFITNGKNLRITPQGLHLLKIYNQVKMLAGEFPK